MSTLSFEPELPNRPYADICIMFGKWLKLYQDNPHKTLSYKSPYEAVEQMLDPSGNHTLQNLCDKYLIFAEQSFKHTRNGDLSPNWQRLNLAISFLKPFMSWPLKSFGADEFRKVQQELIDGFNFEAQQQQK